MFEAGFITAAGVALFLYGYRMMILSRVAVIERDRIVEIRFRHGAPGQTASRFIVFFKDEKMQLQKRRILLTSRPDYVNDDAREAVAIMNRHFEIKEVGI
jgi:hypothetical protein